MTLTMPKKTDQKNYLKIQDLNFNYHRNKQLVLSDINLTVSPGEFILITGQSGCGKSTLIRTMNGLIPHFYGGTISGQVNVLGQDVFRSETRQLAADIGFVFQNPENQLFMNTVENEIAFGLENLSTPVDLIRQRVEESLNAVNIKHLRNNSITSLSGGEKQKVAIASVLAMHPQIMILDEPTAELDPESAIDVLNIIKKINQELCLTIILIEHRIDRILSYAHRVIIIENGKIRFDDTPQKFVHLDLKAKGIFLPPMIELGQYFKLDPLPLDIPTLIRQIKPIIDQHNIEKLQVNSLDVLDINSKRRSLENLQPLLECINVSFNYYPEQEILHNISLKFYSNEFIAIIGKNGSGKTTLLKHLNGQLRPNTGYILFEGKNLNEKSIAEIAHQIGFIYQYPAMQFYLDTVEQEIEITLKYLHLSKKNRQETLERILKEFDLLELRETYPRYLSMGEQQKVALASVLAASPKIILLDEPTHGMDYAQKHKFLTYLDNYRKQGNCVILVSHDLEFVSEYCDRIIYMDRGAIIADAEKHQVFANIKEPIFQPQIRKILNQIPNISSNILTLNEFIEIWEANINAKK